MRNLLALIGLVLVLFLGVGWYKGWYQMNVARTSEGTVQVQTDVNAAKVGQDTGTWLHQVGTYIGDQAAKANPPAPPAATPGPATTPAPSGDPDTFFGFDFFSQKGGK